MDVHAFLERTVPEITPGSFVLLRDPCLLVTANKPFRVESVVKGQFDQLVNVRGTDTSCALELEVGQRTGMLLTDDPSEGWWAGLCGQVPANKLLAAAPSTSAQIPEVAPIGARGSATSFPWWLMGLAVGIVITGSAIVLIRRRRPAD